MHACIVPFALAPPLRLFLCPLPRPPRPLPPPLAFLLALLSHPLPACVPHTDPVWSIERERESIECVGVAAAAEHGVVLVCPDTSPRGDGVPDGAEGEWDFGKGAGFYVDATEAPYAVNYNMYTYVTEELPP